MPKKLTLALALLLPAAARQSQTEPHTRSHATAKITVHSSEAKPYDQTAGPALVEIRLNETFTGDIEGESPVRALQVQRNDHSAPAFDCRLQ